uniref:La-related protein 7 n=1 Tax=Cacopsylla melanoneura TaxID=428564 RepID=A0A8D8Q4H1_9HEMI
MSEDMESTTDKDLSDQRNKDSSGGRHRKKQLFQQIMQLMEFYLSDSNLRKDRFFNQLLQDSPEIDLSVFLKCNKLARLTTDPDDIVKALKKSKLLEVTEDGTKVKRTVQVQDKPDVDECTIYVEKLPPDVEHDYIEKVFTKFGKVTYVSLPKFKATGKLKGFAFVEFSCKEEAEKALEAYTELGCRLPSTMAPEALISIQTFEGEKSNVENRLLRPQSAPEPIEELENQPKEQTPDEVPEETKGNVSESSPPQKRRKTGNEGSDEDMSKGDESKDEHEPSSAPEIVGKKKKSRKKKKKTLDTSPESSGMLVLSKQAELELLEEARRGAQRAETLGAFGWLKPQKTNKTFLSNTLKSVLLSNAIASRKTSRSTPPLLQSSFTPKSVKPQYSTSRETSNPIQPFQSSFKPTSIEQHLTPAKQTDAKCSYSRKGSSDSSFSKSKPRPSPCDGYSINHSSSRADRSSSGRSSYSSESDSHKSRSSRSSNRKQSKSSKKKSSSKHAKRSKYKSSKRSKSPEHRSSKHKSSNSSRKKCSKRSKSSKD